jgi:hypothetical protein
VPSDAQVEVQHAVLFPLVLPAGQGPAVHCVSGPQTKPVGLHAGPAPQWLLDKVGSVHTPEQMTSPVGQAHIPPLQLDPEIIVQSPLVFGEQSRAHVGPVPPQFDPVAPQSGLSVLGLMHVDVPLTLHTICPMGQLHVPPPHAEPRIVVQS